MAVNMTQYKDIEAVSIESSALKAVILPEQGGKMAGLEMKETGRQFLVQAPGEKYRKLAYDGDYINAECSGFDEMFPTIDEYTYEKYPWEGAQMPDHGEVCGLPWSFEFAENCECLHCWVYGVRFPYRLDKWIRLESENTLKTEYRLQNLSPFDFDFIWAAHMMISAEENAIIRVPYADGSAVTCVFSSDSGFGRRGFKMHWPEATQSDGQRVFLDSTRTKSKDGCTYKFYFDDSLPQGWCEYVYNDQTTLRLEFTHEAVPYLGIWMNEGVFKDYYNVAFEPCTGSMDRPDKAAAHGQNSILTAYGEYVWSLSLSVR